MTKKELVNKIHELCKGLEDITEGNVETLKTNVEYDGKTYSVYLFGNDEMFDGNRFYQYGIDETGKTYKFYYDGTEDLDEIDYESPIDVEEE